MNWHRFSIAAVASVVFLSAGCARPKAVAPATAPSEQETHPLTIDQDMFQKSAITPLEIIWPQVLDGPTSGDALYQLTIDQAGNVTDVRPLTAAVERSNDSVIRQIMRWKFKPAFRFSNGKLVTAPVEVFWIFHFNTRAYGPIEPLPESDARRLATKIVDPNFPPGTPSGETCSMRIAVDSDGYLIEVIGDVCPGDGLYIPSLHAIQSWQFKPVLENGQPRPYRSEITFRVP